MFRSIIYSLALSLLVVSASGAPFNSAKSIASPKAVELSPYAKAGLTEREAAVHLLDRFAFGARPGETDEVVRMGLDRWLDRQLAVDQSDVALDERLSAYPALSMSDEEIATRYPNPAQIRNWALRDETITPADLAGDQAALTEKLRQYSEKEGYSPPQELISEMMAQKLLRAVYGENQLKEVLVDFWFNHFNVSVTDGRARPYVLAFERDAIRPNVLGRFRSLLEATARQPAMLYYLNNAESSAADNAQTLGSMNRNRILRAEIASGKPVPAAKRKAARGINENYARELMELHTLGVDGGYDQKDVTEVARAFTGWTVLPPGSVGDRARANPEAVRQNGILVEGSFVFRPNLHDASSKTILHQSFPEGGGIAEGDRVLDLLAKSEATARHLSLELAVRFVSDSPPKSLTDRLTKTYLRTGGDLRAMIREIAESPEFWSRSALKAKIKSPFELTVSALRAMNADVTRPMPVIQWIARMGEPLYACVPPTGYPDRAEQWVSAGSLLERMNFGLQLATGRIPGTRIDLLSVIGEKEPESAEDALRIVSRTLLPGRDETREMRRLAGLMGEEGVADRVDAAASHKPLAGVSPFIADSKRSDRADDGGSGRIALAARRSNANPTALELAAGLILGSPEFQRR